MARRYDFRSVVKQAAPSTTTTFSGSELYTDGAVALHVGWVATGGGINWVLSNLTRIRLKANGQDIVSLSSLALRAFIERFGKSNTAPVAGATTFTLPLNMLDAPTWDEADICQFPQGANATLELQWNATPTVNANVQVAFTETSVEPVFSPKLMARALNIPASTPVQTLDVTEPGEIRAIMLNTVGLDRAKIVLNGVQWMHVPGAQNTGVAADLFSELNSMEDVLTLTDPLWVKTPWGQNAASGKSYVELATGAAWAGVGNEFGVWTVEDNILV